MRNKTLLTAFDRTFQPLDIAVEIIATSDTIQFFEQQDKFDLAFFTDSNGNIHSYSTREHQDIRIPLFPDKVASRDLTLLQLLKLVEFNEFIVFLEETTVTTLVSWQDFNKSPVTDWVFSQLSLLEKTLKKLIERHFLDIEEEAITSLSSDWQERIISTHSFLKTNNAETSIIDSFYFRDCLHIANNQGWLKVIEHKPFSKKELKSIFHRLNTLRNNLAHTKPIINKKSDIKNLRSAIEIIREWTLKLEGLDTIPIRPLY